ncbi:MAG: translocation/assembly module TamB domain-containing protein [Planctomycetota bacterium]
MRVLAAFVLLLVGLYLLRQPLFGDLVAKRVSVVLSDALGVPVKVDRVLGTWVTNARIESITVDADSDVERGVLDSFEADQIEVHFSLWKILAGNVVDAIQGVEADNLRLRLDFTRPTVDDGSEPPSLEEVVAAVPARFPPIDIEARLEAVTGLGVVQLEGLRISSPGDHVLSMDAGQIVLPDPAGRAGEFHARIRREAFGLVWESDSEIAGLKLATIDLGAGGRLEAKGTVAGADLSVLLEDQQAAVRTGRLQVDDVPPWVLRLVPDPNLRPSAGFLALDVSATSLDPLEATATLTGGDLVLPEETIRSVSLRVGATDDALVVHSAALDAEHARFEARNVALDTSGSTYGIASLEYLKLHADDLGRWLSVVDRPLAIDVEASSPDGRTVVVKGLAVTGEGVGLRAEGSVVAPADPGDWSSAVLDLALEGEIRDVTLADMEIGGRLALDAQLSGSLAEPSVVGSVRGESLRIDGREVRVLDVEGRYDGGLLDVQRLVLESDAASLDGEARLRIDPLDVEASRLDLVVSDLAGLRALLPDLGLPDVAGSLRGELRLRGDLETIDGEITLAGSDLVVDGVVVDALRVALEGAGATLEVTTLEARGPWGEVTATGTVDPGSARAVVRTLDGRYDSYTLKLLEEARVEFGERGRVEGLVADALDGRLAGTITWSPTLRADVTFERLDLARLVPEVEGRASGSLVLTDDVQRLELLVPELRYDGRTGSVDLLVQQDADGIDLERLAVDAGDALRASGSGRLPLRLGPDGIERLPVRDARFALELSTSDLSAWLPVRVRSLALEASGDGEQVRARVQMAQVPVLDEIDPLASVVVEAEADGGGASLVARLEDDPRATATLRAWTTTGWRWTDPVQTPDDLAGIEVEGTIEAHVPDATAIVPFLPEALVDADGGLRANLQVTGAVTWPQIEGLVEGTGLSLQLRDVPLPVEVPELVVRLHEGELKIVKARLAYATANLAAAGQLDLPEERARGWAGQKVSGEASLNVPELSVLNDVLRDLAPLSGRLQGAVDVTGTLSDPRVQGSVVGEDLSLRLAGTDETVRVPLVRLAYLDDVLTVEEATILVDDARLEVKGSADLRGDPAFEDAPLDVTLRGEVPSFGLLGRLVPDVAEATGSASVDATVRGTLSAPDVAGRVVLSNVGYPLEAVGETLRIERATIRAEGRQLVLDEALVALGTARIQLGGTVGLPAELEGDWAAVPLDLRADLDVADFSLLGALDAELKRLNGRVRGQVTARGVLGDPELSGTLELVGVGGRLPGSFPSLDDVNGRIEFVGQRATLVDVRGGLGRSPFTLGGTVDWADGGPPTLDVRLAGDNLLLTRTRDLRARADVDVRATGPLDQLLLAGNVRITDALYVATTSFLGGGGAATAGDGVQLFSIPDGPMASMRFEIDVRAEETIRVRTNVMRGDITASVRLQGTGAEPALVGRVSFPDMLVKLPFSSLKVDRGEARFDEADPTQPYLEAEAHTEMKGYELSVRVRGRLPEIDIRVASVPPLPQNEAILLLTTGATGEELAREGLARAALTRIGSVFGQSLLSGGGRGPEDPDDLGFFDRFTFTQGREISRSGQETIEAEFEMTDRFFLRVERDRYDNFNAGVVWRWRFR